MLRDPTPLSNGVRRREKLAQAETGSRIERTVEHLYGLGADRATRGRGLPAQAVVEIVGDAADVKGRHGNPR